MTANERRAEIMRILIAKRHNTMSELAHELAVTSRTIRSDIVILTAEYPLETVRGNGGGVKVSDWYHPHKHILTEKHQAVLIQILEKSNKHEEKVLQEIITAYGSPMTREQLKKYSEKAENTMTVKELSQIRHLNKEIKQYELRLAELEKVAGTSKITDSSCVKSTIQKTAPSGGIKAELISRKQACMTEYDRLMRYITSVEDSFMRQIFNLRYVNGFSWVRVAMHIGGGNTADSVRKAHKRFLEKQK